MRKTPAMIANRLRRNCVLLLIGLLVLVSVDCGGSPTTTPGESKPSSSPSADCKNPYFPISPTSRREYRTILAIDPKTPRPHTESISDVAGDSFRVNMTFGEENVNAHFAWRCTPAGLVALDYGSVGAPQGGFKFTTLNVTGVAIPPEEKWQPGSKWEMNYDVSGQTVQAAKSVLGNVKGAIKINSEIIGSEQVTVPAGTFTALKVRMTLNQKLDISVTGGGMPMDVPANNTFVQTTWFAKDVGMVKSAFENSATTELVSFTK